MNREDLQLHYTTSFEYYTVKYSKLQGYHILIIQYEMLCFFVPWIQYFPHFTMRPKNIEVKLGD